MFIVKAIGLEIPIDYDELPKLTAESQKPLIFFRRGAINPKHIVGVVEDNNRRESVMKLPGDTKETLEKKMREETSVDIFKSIRGPALPEGEVRPRLHGGQ